jgi:hypothetical protein
MARRRWSVRAASAGELATARRPAAAGVRDSESGSGARRWKGHEVCVLDIDALVLDSLSCLLSDASNAF